MVFIPKGRRKLLYGQIQPKKFQEVVMGDGGLGYKKRRVFYFAGLLYSVAVTTIVSLLLYRFIQTLEQKASFQQLPDYEALAQFDPEREGGHLLPNLNLDVRGEFGAVHFITNSKGFRNTKEFDYMPSPGVSRILLLGDSYVDGMRTDQEHMLVAITRGETVQQVHCHTERLLPVEELTTRQFSIGRRATS
jgi:hypothetical protein